MQRANGKAVCVLAATELLDFGKWFHRANAHESNGAARGLRLGGQHVWHRYMCETQTSHTSGAVEACVHPPT